MKKLLSAAVLLSAGLTFTFAQTTKTTDETTVSKTEILTGNEVKHEDNLENQSEIKSTKENKKYSTEADLKNSDSVKAAPAARRQNAAVREKVE